MFVHNHVGRLPSTVSVETQLGNGLACRRVRIDNLIKRCIFLFCRLIAQMASLHPADDNRLIPFRLNQCGLGRGRSAYWDDH